MTTEIGNNLKKARELMGLNQDQMAEKIGVHKQQYSKYERGVHRPGTRVFVKMEEMGINPNFILTGRGAIRMDEKELREGGFLEEEAGRREDDKLYQMIPVFKKRPPCVINGHPVVKLMLLKNYWQDLALDRLALLTITEPNMHPTIPVGSLICVDKEDRQLTESFYLMRVGDNHSVKRIKPLMNGMVRVISDNPAFGEEIAEADEVRAAVEGRVRWVISRV